MSELIDITSYPVREVLSRLLADKSTGRNIIFATDNYRFSRCEDTDEMTPELLLGYGAPEIQPRVEKSQSEQADRTRSKAEVFTPLRIVRQMTEQCDRSCASDNWKTYVQKKVLEITCGEAPFLVTRYDTTSGELIPLAERCGVLDRKLKAVGENAQSEEEWLKWAVRAFESTYGYEFQGDNLLIARINLLLTFCEYLEDRFHRRAADSELKRMANLISWNLWQMDGLKDTVPMGARERYHQLSWFESECKVQLLEETDGGQMSLLDGFETEQEQEQVEPCRIYNHRTHTPLLFGDIRKGKTRMKFDFVIGNPPYQEDTEGTSDKPIYNVFMDAAFTVSDKVELITPARFLFNAGKTPKQWNQKMLSDEHFKVLYYEQDSSKVFKNTDIKGGVAVTYRDNSQDFGAIGTFSIFAELNSILKKVINRKDFKTIDDAIVQQNRWDLQALYEDYPEYTSKIGSDGKERRLTTPIFKSLDLFHDDEQKDDLKILGLINNKRVYKYINQKYIDKNHENLYSYKVILPASNGSGAIGEVLSTPLCGTPLCGYTQSFIGIGCFESREEAENALKYIKSKFARTMLGTLKITQHNHKGTWINVPLQDFTPESDIDWSKPVHDIDRQLYNKYGLTDEEIEFIESRVKEME